MNDRHPKKRLKPKDENGNTGSGRWLITYSDLITLLLVFFVMMFAMSTVENQRFNALISSLKTSLSGNSILESMKYTTTDSNDKSKRDAESIPPVAKKLTDQEKKKDQEKLDALYTHLDKYIKTNHLQPDVSLVETSRGVQLTFREKILFDLGSAEIKPNAIPVLKRIGGMLQEVPNEVSIEGHTDNTPFRNNHSTIHSNWELSGVRAQTVMNFLISQDKLSPHRFHFVGYGEYRPVVKNDTPNHKAMNRRVNIVVIREDKVED